MDTLCSSTQQPGDPQAQPRAHGVSIGRKEGAKWSPASTFGSRKSFAVRWLYITLSSGNSTLPKTVAPQTVVVPFLQAASVNSFRPFLSGLVYLFGAELSTKVLQVLKCHHEPRCGTVDSGSPLLFLIFWPEIVAMMNFACVQGYGLQPSLHEHTVLYSPHVR